MKHSITLLFLLFVGTHATFATGNSVILYRDSLVEISYNTSKCNDTINGTYREYHLLKFTNLTAKEVEVQFRKELWYDGKCTTCNSTSVELQMSVTLEPNESKTGSCEKREKELSVFSRMLDMKKSELSSFELKNVSVRVVKE